MLPQLAFRPRWSVLVVSMIGMLSGCGDSADQLPRGRWWNTEAAPAAPAGPRPRAPGPSKPQVGQRHCAIILLNPEKLKDYLALHEEVPAGVKKALREHHIRDFSVFVTVVDDPQYRDQYYAVRTYQYTGENHAADLATLERDPEYRQWQAACEECEVPLAATSIQKWWTPMREVFHAD